jgi:spore coat protein U-like protein
MGLGNLRQSRLPGRPTLRQRAAARLLAVAALASPAPALAQAVTDSAIADATAAIMAPGTVIKLADMDFGQIAQPSVAGNVTMSPNFPTCTPSAGILHLGSVCQPARFAVHGRKNWKVRIREMSGGAIVLTGPGGATMTVTMLSLGTTDMTPSPGGGNPPGSFGRQEIASDSGIAEFRIGGRLNIGANQAAGAYTGTMTIQVLFN